MKEKPILRNKAYLYLTEFFAGMSIMAVELGASRLLAPYFSSSQIVWTIIIGTIMIAMALGNIYGGRSADKDPDPDRLYKRMIFAALWIAGIPVLGKYVILAISGALIFSISNNFLIIAAFVACMVIFVFPLFLLGTVTPSLVKYTTDSLDDNGRIVGALCAYNTVGSIIGTFLPTFVTIPAVGTSITFLIFAGILLALALIYFFSTRAKLKTVAVSIVVFLICVTFGHNNSFAFWEDDLKYEGESVYNYLQVKETESSIILSTNVLFGVQSILKKDEGMTGMYYDYAMAAPLMAKVGEKENLDVLILGMGTGTYASQCMHYFDNVNVEGVEIDEKITGLAAEHFELSGDVPVTTYDGRAYLNATDRKYDVIMVDAYQDITIPFQMATIEFFDLVKKHLTADGVMVLNMNMRGQKEGNINQYLADTVSNVFREVYTVDVLAGTNRELFASNAKGIKEVMRKNIGIQADIAAKEEEEDRKTELIYMMNRVSRDMKAYKAGDYCLTDDRAPVELLSMRAIDDIIKDEVKIYKGLYERYGVSGLLDYL
jgi:spermidine synthase